MDYDQACNTDSSKVTLPSDDKSKVSERSMLVENNAKNVHNDEKSNFFYILLKTKFLKSNNLLKMKK